MSEKWKLQKEEMQRLEAFEMKCYQRLQGVSWQERIRNTNSPKNLTQKLIDADDYETQAWYVEIYMPNE